MTAFANSTNNHEFHTGPPSARTRSQARHRSRTSPTLAPSPLTPRTGSLAHHRSTTISQAHASQRLRRSRLKLRRYLVTDRWRADDPHDKLTEPTDAQIAQLGVLARDGRIIERPPWRPGSWRSEERMRKFRRRGGSGASLMGDVWRNPGEEEMQDVFGILPGEEWNQWGIVEGKVLDGLADRFAEEGRCEDAIWNGERVEGVWRDVVCDRPGGDADVVLRWIRDERRKREWSVMDQQCVRVVRQVMTGNDV